LKPINPCAITSEGEIVTAKPGAYVPPRALAGSPMSAVTVEDAVNPVTESRVVEP